MSITYSIAIDYADDGTFTELDDILSIEWHLGLPAPYTHIADISSASITIRNQSRNFSPEVMTDFIGKRLRIQSDDSTSIRTHFIGFVKEIRPQTGNQGERLSEIIALGREYELTQHRVRLPFQTNFRADTAIEDIIEQIDWRYDILEGRCIIGRDSIGSSDIFPTERISKTLETGKSTFAFIADNWADGLEADRAINELAEGEGGRFFFDREGQASFHNRHHLLLNNTISATFADDMSDLVYDYGNVINDVEILLTPRAIGDSNTLIWALANPIRVRAGGTIQIIARYKIDDEPVGAFDILSPKSGADYTAHLEKETNTLNITDDFEVRVVEANMSATVFEIRNRVVYDGYLTKLNLYGTPLYRRETLTVKAEDSNSIAYYGRHATQKTLPVITDIEEAIAIANWDLQRHHSPYGRVRELHTNTRNHPEETLSLSLFDLINVQESQSGHSANYAIIAEHHQVDMAGTRHQVCWHLEPSDSDLFFIIGTHSIGDEVILAPR